MSFHVFTARIPLSRILAFQVTEGQNHGAVHYMFDPSCPLSYSRAMTWHDRDS